METIPKSDCIEIGSLQRQHGLKGEIQLRFEPQYGTSLEKVNTIFLEHDGLLVPYFIPEDGLRFRSNESALISLEWINNDNQAKELSGLSVYISREDYIKEDEEFGLHELVGFTLIDTKIGEIGKILQVDDFAGNLLLTVSYKENEIMVPFSEDFLVELDDEKYIVKMNCPEGLFDI